MAYLIYKIKTTVKLCLATYKYTPIHMVWEGLKWKINSMPSQTMWIGGGLCAVKQALRLTGSPSCSRLDVSIIIIFFSAEGNAESMHRIRWVLI